MSHNGIRALQIILHINILMDQMKISEKIPSKRLKIQRITSIFNKNQRDHSRSKSATFPYLDKPIFIILRWLGYQKASISFGEDNGHHVSWIYCIFFDVERHKMWILINMKIWVNFSWRFSKSGPRQMTQKTWLICFDT